MSIKPRTFITLINKHKSILSILITPESLNDIIHVLKSSKRNIELTKAKVELIEGGGLFIRKQLVYIVFIIIVVLNMALFLHKSRAMTDINECNATINKYQSQTRMVEKYKTELSSAVDKIKRQSVEYYVDELLPSIVSTSVERTKEFMLKSINMFVSVYNDINLPDDVKEFRRYASTVNTQQDEPLQMIQSQSQQSVPEVSTGVVSILDEQYPVQVSDIQITQMDRAIISKKYPFIADLSETNANNLYVLDKQYQYYTAEVEGNLLDLWSNMSPLCRLSKDMNTVRVVEDKTLFQSSIEISSILLSHTMIHSVHMFQMIDVMYDGYTSLSEISKGPILKLFEIPGVSKLYEYIPGKKFLYVCLVLSFVVVNTGFAFGRNFTVLGLLMIFERKHKSLLPKIVDMIVSGLSANLVGYQSGGKTKICNTCNKPKK